jgi:hypothetical protein
LEAEQDEDDHEDGAEDSPLLPIFSAAHLGWLSTVELCRDHFC